MMLVLVARRALYSASCRAVQILRQCEMTEIIEASAPDLRKIAGMINAEFPYTKTTLGGLRKRFREKETVIFKAVEGEDFAGFVEFEIKEGTGRILGLGVEKEFRNREVGTKLAGFAVKFMQEHGAHEIRLLVRRGNKTAKKIYEKAGFRIASGEQKIAGEIVEEMVLGAGQEKPDYVR